MPYDGKTYVVNMHADCDRTIMKLQSENKYLQEKIKKLKKYIKDLESDTCPGCGEMIGAWTDEHGLIVCSHCRVE